MFLALSSIHTILPGLLQVQYGYINLETVFRDSTNLSVGSLVSLLAAKIAATSVSTRSRRGERVPPGGDPAMGGLSRRETTRMRPSKGGIRQEGGLSRRGIACNNRVQDLGGLAFWCRLSASSTTRWTLITALWAQGLGLCAVRPSVTGLISRASPSVPPLEARACSW